MPIKPGITRKIQIQLKRLIALQAAQQEASIVDVEQLKEASIGDIEHARFSIRSSKLFPSRARVLEHF